MLISRIRGGFANQVFCMIAGLEAAKQLDTELMFDVSCSMNGMTRGCFINFLIDGKYNLINYYLSEPRMTEHETIHNGFVSFNGITADKAELEFWNKNGGAQDIFGEKTYRF